MTREERRNVEIKKKELKLQGRLMSDSALTTFFGKPAFHAYGNSNVHPAQGGLVYGDYMKTHNINPHSGANEPKSVQVYKRAMRGIQEVVEDGGPRNINKPKPVVMQSRRVRAPEPPR